MKGEPFTRAHQSAEKKRKRWHDHEELFWAVREWAVRIGVKAPQVRLQAMEKQWGMMPSPGEMLLHPQLLMLPRDLGEYVIAHELVHLLVPNHSKLFKSFLYAYLPDWEEREQRLQSYSAT